MKRHIAYLLVWCMLLFAGVAPRAAFATACTVPNSFTAGTPAVASQVNANFASLQSCANNIDHTNMGTAGIYASQIIPDTAGHATFGGSIAYTFANGLAISGGQFTFASNASYTASSCLATDNFKNVASTGTPCQLAYNAAGGVQQLSVTFVKSISATSCPNTPGTCTWTGGNTVALPSTTYTNSTSFACFGLNGGTIYNGYAVMFQNSTDGSHVVMTLYTIGSGFGFSSATPFNITVHCDGY